MQAGHLQVEQHEIGRLALEHREPLAPVAGTAHREAAVLEVRADALEAGRVVVHDHEPRRAVGASPAHQGSRSRQATSPSIARARTRMSKSGFLQDVLGQQPGRGERGGQRVLGRARVDDEAQGRITPVGAPDQLVAVHARQADVDDGHVDPPRRQGRQRLLAARGALDREALVGQEGLDAAAHRLVVVDHQHAADRSAHACPLRVAVPVSAGLPAIGSRTLNRAPAPGEEATLISPPCRSATMKRETESPSPVPPLSPFVLKKGSNTHWRVASSMPGPLSATSSTAHGGSSRVATRIQGEAGGRACSAWAAFLIRFRITSSTSVARHGIARQVGRVVAHDLEAAEVVALLQVEVGRGQRDHAVGELGQVGRRAAQLARPRETEHVGHDPRGPTPRGADPLEHLQDLPALGVGAHRGELGAAFERQLLVARQLRREPAQHVLRPVHDPAQRVVDLVGDAGRDAADRHHLLGLRQQAVHPHALAHVVDADHGAPACSRASG